MNDRSDHFHDRYDCVTGSHSVFPTRESLHGCRNLPDRYRSWSPTPDQHIPQGSSGSAPRDRLAERPPTPGGVYGQLSLLESIGAFVGTANQDI
jgi:hypothetical protein